MNTLDEIALKYSTDKSSKFHYYTKIYESVLSPYRDKNFHMLEIGVSKGRSLLTWLEYFPNATIYGIDIKPVCFKFNSPRSPIFIGSQTDKEFLINTVKSSPHPFSVIIDDGGHTSDQQIITFETLFPLLINGGIYIVEDLHTSYQDKYNKRSPIRGIDYFKNLIDDLNMHGKIECANKYECIKDQTVSFNYYERYIESMSFFKSVCIIKKMSK